MYQRYLERLSDRDLEILAMAIGRTSEPDTLRGEIRKNPGLLGEWLAEPGLVDLIFDPRHGLDVAPSPQLVFGVMVHRVAMDLVDAPYVVDWIGPKSRLPVFDVDPLKEFLEDPGRRWFLVELLDSFAGPEGKIAGFHLPALAAAIDQVHPTMRGQLLRRMGDLALFLTGVFPDHTGSRPVHPIEAERLGRAAGMSDHEILSLSAGKLPTTAGMDWMEALGERWYRMALDQGRLGASFVPPVVGDVAGRFTSGRRVLNVLTDRFLYRFRPDWLPGAA
jgi:hypothetical protein